MIVNRLVRLRKDKNETQETVATKLGLSQPRYNHYESGKREPDHDLVVALADYFDTTIDYLLGRTDDPHPTSKREAAPEPQPPSERDAPPQVEPSSADEVVFTVHGYGGGPAIIKRMPKADWDAMWEMHDIREELRRKRENSIFKD
jgi:transcriptional regulator with XRE-family HTH domain